MPRRKSETKKVSAWLIAVDMGYGHQRAAYPLRHFAQRRQVISANSYPGIPVRDRQYWRQGRKFYEFISLFTRIPVIGQKVFELYDRLQSIPQFYPRRDLSMPNLQLRQIYYLIKKKEWGKHLITYLNGSGIPIVTTFFVPAFMAEVHGYSGEIYCLATDSDISRAWVPLNPHTSRIKYFAPNLRVAERLKLYGVHADNIIMTGFPLPEENIGPDEAVLRSDFLQRLVNLDPQGKYRHAHGQTIQQHLAGRGVPAKSNHPLTIMFAVGGAGAQRDIGEQILHSLKRKILKKNVRMVLVAGIHNAVNSYFRAAARRAGLGRELDGYVKIIYAQNKNEYFKKFNAALRTTDILWTKPSELSFYCALGLPIIIAPPIGSQEEFNKTWLTTIGSGIEQEDPRYTHQWLFDWLDSGWLAEAAMEGYIEAPRQGTGNIRNIVAGTPERTEAPETISQF